MKSLKNVLVFLYRFFGTRKMSHTPRKDPLMVFIILFIALTNTSYSTNVGIPQFKALGKAFNKIELFGKDVDGAIRLYGKLGYSFLNKDIDDKNKISYQTGIQGLVLWGGQELYLGVGFDLSNNHFYKIQNYTASYVNSFLIGELNLVIFDFQLGMGPCFGVGDASGVDYGLMLAVGSNIYILDNLSFLIQIRTDWIFADNTITSLGLSIGCTYYFMK